MRINPYKRAFRALGIAESFRKDRPRSIIFGVVFRRDGIIDGAACEAITVGGLDATQGVISIYRKLRREDIKVIVLGGCIISWFNIVDLEKVHEATKRPVICVTYRQSRGIEKYLMEYFEGEDANIRLALYSRLKPREKVYIGRQRSPVYVRYVGVDRETAREVLRALTFQGRVPEPLRIARLMAKACLDLVYGE